MWELNYKEGWDGWVQLFIQQVLIHSIPDCVLDAGHTLKRKGNICLHIERYNWVSIIYAIIWGFSSASVGKESTCNAGDTGDVGSILGQEDPLEKEMVNHSSILAWKIPWAEEPGGLQSKG